MITSKMLDKIGNKVLFHMCMEFGADIEDVVDNKIFWKDHAVQDRKSDCSSEGYFVTYEVKNPHHYEETLTRMQEALADMKREIALIKSDGRHIISMTIGYGEVSMQVFNREKAMLWLKNHSESPAT